MRDVKFKAKRLDNGQWIYGYIYEHEPPLQAIATAITEESTWYIVKTASADWNLPREVEFIKIDPDTICQFTGLKDRNGVDIYEGDIMNYKGNVVEFCNGGFCVNGDSDIALWVNMKVIGNIFDNKENNL